MKQHSVRWLVVTAINHLSDAQASGIATTSILRRDDESAQPELPTGNSDAGKVELMKRLTEARKITVVLDGALFEDGTFIGPDSSNFYGWLSSLVESRKDLIQNLKTIQRDGNPSKVQERLEEENRVPRISLGPHSTYDDFYKFNRRSFAQSLLRLKNAVGDDAIRRELETSSERWLKLRKS